VSILRVENPQVAYPPINELVGAWQKTMYQRLWPSLLGDRPLVADHDRSLHAVIRRQSHFATLFGRAWLLGQRRIWRNL